jgi:phage terminase large subunit GpA-like protein
MTYDPSLPVGFCCPHCGKNGKLRGGEAEHQTPKEFLPQFLRFLCPTCQQPIKALVTEGRWQNDSAGQNIFFLNKTDYA